MTYRGRRGMALPLVIVLVTVAAVAIFVFQHVVQSEAHSTHKLVRTLQAEAICDRVVNRLAAVVGQHTWEDRFYLLDAMARAPGSSTMPEAKYLFDQDRFPFGNEGPDFASGDAAFTGSVKDTNAIEQRYRVTVKARYKGVSVLGVYDLTHARGTMGPLNRSAIDLRVMKIDEAPLDAAIDQEMDAIPTEALKPENVLGPNFPVPSIPSVFAPPGAAPQPSAGEQTAGLVGGKLVPAFNPPSGIAPGTPEATQVAQATSASAAKAGGRAQTDFTRTRSGQIPPGSVLQPGAAVPAPRRPGAPPPGPPPDPNADPFASDPGALGNGSGTYTPAGWDPSLGNSGPETTAPDGTQTPVNSGGAPSGPEVASNAPSSEAPVSSEETQPPMNPDGTPVAPENTDDTSKVDTSKPADNPDDTTKPADNPDDSNKSSTDDSNKGTQNPPSEGGATPPDGPSTQPETAAPESTTSEATPVKEDPPQAAPPETPSETSTSDTSSGGAQ